MDAGRRPLCPIRYSEQIQKYSENQKKYFKNLFTQLYYTSGKRHNIIQFIIKAKYTLRHTLNSQGTLTP